MADATVAKLLDFSGPFDTPLLEQTVAAFYTGSPDQVRTGLHSGRRAEEARGGEEEGRSATTHALARLLPLRIRHHAVDRRTPSPLSPRAHAPHTLDAHARILSRAPSAVVAPLPLTPLNPRNPNPKPKPKHQRTAAEAALKAFQEHPQSWTRVDAILEQAKSEQTKFYALQVG